MPHPPKIAMEVYDVPPEDWAEAALEPFKDVVNDPVAWAKKCVESYGADLITLQLVSTDPNGLNRSGEEAAQTAKKVAARSMSRSSSGEVGMRKKMRMFFERWPRPATA